MGSQGTSTKGLVVQVFLYNKRGTWEAITLFFFTAVSDAQSCYNHL